MCSSSKYLGMCRWELEEEDEEEEGGGGRACMLYVGTPEFTVGQLRTYWWSWLFF